MDCQTLPWWVSKVMDETGKKVKHSFIYLQLYKNDDNKVRRIDDKSVNKYQTLHLNLLFWRDINWRASIITIFGGAKLVKYMNFQ